MTVLILLLVILAVLFVLYFWAIHPACSGRKRCRPFAHRDYAHRGLWDMKLGIPENSMPAFERAVQAGYGIELDVHLTKDHQLAVLHDGDLKRVSNLDQTPESMTWQELSECRLLGTEYTVPLLSDVLELVNGRVPLLIEMKLPTRNTALCAELNRLLESYSGSYLIESFNPFGLRWYKKHRPDIVRGQLAARYQKSDKFTTLICKCSTALLVNALSRPDFISYHYQHTDTLGCRILRKLFHTPFWVWTVKEENAYQICARNYDAVIFENIIPHSET